MNSKASAVANRDAAASWSVRVQGDVITVTLSGRVLGETVAAAVAETQRRLLTSKIRFVVIDTVACSTYTPDVRGPGAQLLEIVKAQGAVSGVCITTSSAVRMMGTAAAFVSGVKVEFVSTPAEAAMKIDEQRQRLERGL